MNNVLVSTASPATGVFLPPKPNNCPMYSSGVLVGPESTDGAPAFADAGAAVEEDGKSRTGTAALEEDPEEDELEEDAKLRAVASSSCSALGSGPEPSPGADVCWAELEKAPTGTGSCRRLRFGGVTAKNFRPTI